jgi:hypothetical protein
VSRSQDVPDACINNGYRSLSHCYCRQSFLHINVEAKILEFSVAKCIAVKTDFFF